MRDYPVKAPGDTFTAEEFNESIGGELENFITKSGISLAALTTNQMSQAATLYTGASTFFLESGVADAYVGNVISPFEAPPSLPDGFIARLFPGNTNTGASTLNLAGTGIKAIVKDAGLDALTGGEIVVNEILVVQFDLGTNQWQIIQSGFQIGAAGAGAVDSVFGRSGAVVAVLDDYKASLVDNDSAVTGDTVKDALNTLNAEPNGRLIQRITNTTATASTTTAVIPFDDTIPQNTEGTEILTVTITPTNASNILVVQAKINASISSGEDPAIITLFKNSGANAISAQSENLADNNPISAVELKHDIVAGGTSAITFKIRIGVPDVGTPGTLTINGSGSVRKFGGVLISSLEVMEIKV